MVFFVELAKCRKCCWRVRRSSCPAGRHLEPSSWRRRQRLGRCSSGGSSAPCDGLLGSWPTGCSLKRHHSRRSQSCCFPRIHQLLEQSRHRVRGPCRRHPRPRSPARHVHSQDVGDRGRGHAGTSGLVVVSSSWHCCQPCTCTDGSTCDECKAWTSA